MAKITDQIITDIEEKMLQGEDLKDLRRDLKNVKGYSGAQVNTIVLAAKDAIRERVSEMKDILPELNLYRLNQLYVTSVNSAPKDRAAIIREMNQLLGLYKQEVDLNVGFNFVIDENDEVTPDGQDC